MTPTLPAAPGFVEEVEIHGHIIDSLLLAQGARRNPDARRLLRHQGHPHRPAAGRPQPRPHRGPRRQRRPAPAKTSSTPSTITAPCPSRRRTAPSSPADMDGAFPEGFYSTTNYRTQVRLGGEWVDVEDQEMDCGILVDAGGGGRPLPADDRRAQGRPHRRRPAGAARLPGRRRRPAQNLFEFMASPVSSEKPKGVTVREIAAAMKPHPRRPAKRSWPCSARPSSTPAASSTSAS